MSPLRELFCRSVRSLEDAFCTGRYGPCALNSLAAGDEAVAVVAVVACDVTGKISIGVTMVRRSRTRCYSARGVQLPGKEFIHRPHLFMH